MPTDPTSRTLVTITLLGVAAWLIWLVRDVLPPFIAAFALALLLDPVIDRMQRRGLPRSVAVAIAFFAMLGVLAGVVMAVLPRAIGQVSELIGNIGPYGQRLQTTLDAWARDHGEQLRRFGLPVSVNEFWRLHQAEITRYLQGALQTAFLSLQSFAGALGWLLIVPIVTLYLMMDLDAMKARLHHVIPVRHQPFVENLSVEVGRVFAAYLRGLIAVCLSYGVAIYFVLGMLFGLDYAVILALLAVVLYAIPYLGQLTLLVAAVGVAWATGNAAGYITGVAICIVLVGQLFDQLITPRVMGKQVGLHPVLGVFALMVGGNLFGLPGMVVAVPAAASIRVVLIKLFPKLGEPLPGHEPKPKRSLFRRKQPEIAVAEPVGEAPYPESGA
jgi:predicted PurR-regulated permease PerM